MKEKKAGAPIPLSPTPPSAKLNRETGGVSLDLVENAAGCNGCLTVLGCISVVTALFGQGSFQERILQVLMSLIVLSVYWNNRRMLKQMDFERGQPQVVSDKFFYVSNYFALGLVALFILGTAGIAISNGRIVMLPFFVAGCVILAAPFWLALLAMKKKRQQEADYLAGK